MTHVVSTIATELNVRETQVQAAIALLDEGATVPFIARYRKEVTNGLDDTQLRTLAARLTYLRDFNERRQVILKSIADQGKLSDSLHSAIQNAQTKTELEDLYLPFKPKRRTKGQIAIEAGLQPLADLLLCDPQQQPELAANTYINIEAGFADTKAVLEGARYIVMERFAEDASLLKQIRQRLWQEADLSAQVAPGKEQEGAKFRDYFNYQEPIRKVPSHRALALLRGRNEGILQVQLNADPQQDESVRSSQFEQLIASHFKLQFTEAPADAWRQQAVQWTWRIKILPRMETDLLGQLREAAEDAAIQVFATNLKALLMAAPAGQRITMGIDPGLRTGIKAAVVDGTGKLLGQSTYFPHAPQNVWDKTLRSLAAMCKTYQVELIAIGNGTASRETDKLVGELIKMAPELKLTKAMVSEAGASVYSASELAAREFPNLDVSYRGAVSIARRLQDPLAELVKIEPKAIGVGQYQHDVSQSLLAESLDAVVEDGVNAVGVDVNTASAPLLSRISGLSRIVAQNIVNHRDNEGPFASRKALLKVARMGPKAFEQAAGFLRIMHAANPLDGSAVHPEAYPVAARIATENGRQVADIIGDVSFLRSLNPADYTDATFGVPTVADIIQELEKPGRDPRPEFKTASFKEGIETLKDLKPGMTLEGIATNITNFGAFVDIGVHQDGLVHISALSEQFVKDPHDVIKAGQVVKVKVLEVDVPRKRISLTMRLNDEVPTPSAVQSDAQSDSPKAKASRRNQQRNGPAKTATKPSAPKLGNAAMGNAFAEAFANAKKS